MHLWLRAEQRAHEQRAALTPEGAAKLCAAGVRLTVEESPARCFDTADYARAGAGIAPEGSWPDAPAGAIVLGLKELPDDGTPLIHTHIFFGHAFKGQPAGRKLLDRFAAGGGKMLDLEYLVDEAGKRVAAFGFWAGYAGAAVALKCWAAQQKGTICGPVSAYASSTHLLADLQSDLLAQGTARPIAIVIGALGRVGRGATSLCTAMGVPVTQWDMAQTAHGGPFPEIYAHDLFLNAIVAQPGAPVFVPASAITAPRKLSVIGDIACDPDSDYSPIKVYDRVTSWDAPALRVADAPMLDVTAIDNLPSMLPCESSEDFADQLLPHLEGLAGFASGTRDDAAMVWERAAHVFRDKSGT